MAFSVGIAYLCHLISIYFSFSLPWFIESPGIFAIYGALFFLFDRYLWKKVFFGIHFSNIPNFSGSWYGTFLSSYTGKDNPRYCMMVVRQTWTCISIEYRVDSSKSYSNLAAVVLNRGRHPELRYEYENDPNNLEVNTMHKHSGTTKLEYSETENSLQGGYYTCRERCTHGEIHLFRVSVRCVSHEEAKKIYIEHTLPTLTRSYTILSR